MEKVAVLSPPPTILRNAMHSPVGKSSFLINLKNEKRDGKRDDDEDEGRKQLNHRKYNCSINSHINAIAV